jgi:DNA-binding NarL/FixJ family response regulator
MRVLIADNSSLLRRQLIELLSELDGVEIIGQAQDPQEALFAIRALRPDVITLDIEMPGGSGIDVLRQIRQDDLAPIVIILTNNTSLPYRKKCMQFGADFFIDKAIGISEVTRIVQGLSPRFKTEDA